MSNKGELERQLRKMCDHCRQCSNAAHRIRQADQAEPVEPPSSINETRPPPESGLGQSKR